MFNSKLKARIDSLEDKISGHDVDVQALTLTMKDVIKGIQKDLHELRDEQRRIVSNFMAGKFEIDKRSAVQNFGADVLTFDLKEKDDKRGKTSGNRKNSKGVSGRVGKAKTRKSGVKVRKRAVKKATGSSRQSNKACEG